MKTITLSDEAYDRLRAWKRAPKDSFSQIVLRVVPPRGTLASLGEALDRLPPLTADQAEVMETEVRSGNDWKANRDPWSL
jgi:predicted CopG family antitoxin